MEQTPSSQSEIVAYVRATYTLHGVNADLDAHGQCVLSLPPDYPDLTALITVLDTQFGAICDLKASPPDTQLRVWPRPSRHAEPYTRKMVQSVLAMTMCMLLAVACTFFSREWMPWV
jgi:hypothetical protein